MDMDKWIQLNNQAAGRDKIARFLQYLSRAIWYDLEKSDISPALSDRFKTIEYILSTFRKLLRFGKCVDVFYGSLRTIHNQDLIIRVTLTIGKITQALFLFADHLLYLSRTGMFSSINVKKWAKHANRYWLFSIIMNLCRDVYEIYRLLDLHKASKRSGITKYSSSPVHINSPQDLSRLILHSYSLMLGHKNVLLDTVKNVCDVFIPMTALGFTKLSPRTIGILGAISSVAGLLALVDSRAKLVPS